MDVSLAKLQQLLTVARCGSFSRAAEELHISQPALSRSVAAAERRCGFAIFNRIGHGVQLTAAGSQMLDEAIPLLQSMRVFQRNVSLIGGGVVGTLRIGLPPLLASQLLLFSETQIEPGPELDCSPVGAITPVCVVRAGHPLATRAGLTRAELGRYPWASSVEPPAMAEMMSAPRFTCDNYHVLREAVLQSELTGIFSLAFVADDITTGRLAVLDVPGLLPPATPIHAARLKGRLLSPLATRTVERIAALLA